MFVRITVSDSDIRQFYDCTCLCHLGQRDTDRIISISLIWPRQARKVISCRDITGDIVLNSASVNMTESNAYIGKDLFGKNIGDTTLLVFHWNVFVLILHW